MKHIVSDKTFRHWAPALLRNGLTAECAHAICPVRKCRRDGCCSGPLIADADDNVRRLAPADRGALRADEALIPACFRLLPHAAQGRVALAYAAGIAALRARPGAIVVEPARATGVRIWKKLDLGAFQEQA